jgi:hypothetical protein
MIEHESAHWRATERLLRGTAIGSVDVRRILMYAEWRRLNPSWWDRLKQKLLGW